MLISSIIFFRRANMNYTVIEAKSKKQLKEFADFPNILYENNNYYVPGLLSDDIATFDPNKNPAFEYCKAKYWLAKDENNHTVGRIAAIINQKHIEKFHFAVPMAVQYREGILLPNAILCYRKKLIAMAAAFFHAFKFMGIHKDTTYK